MLIEQQLQLIVYKYMICQHKKCQILEIPCTLCFCTNLQFSVLIREGKCVCIYQFPSHYKPGFEFSLHT